MEAASSSTNRTRAEEIGGQLSSPSKMDCLASIKGDNCGDHGCTACWDRARANVPGSKHESLGPPMVVGYAEWNAS